METPLFPLALFEDDFANVYEPAEDTFLLMDVLEQDLDQLKAMRPSIVVEVGCGSGAVITSLAKAIGNSCCYFATDINHHATSTTLKCNEVNGIPNLINCVLSSLTDAFGSRLDGCVDILIFNPPYVPTSEEELTKSGDISSAWAGGCSGLEVTLQFVKLIPRILSASGSCYFVALEQNDPTKLCELLELKHLKANIVAKRRCGIEKLYIIKASKIRT